MQLRTSDKPPRFEPAAFLTLDYFCAETIPAGIAKEFRKSAAYPIFKESRSQLSRSNLS